MTPGATKDGGPSAADEAVARFVRLQSDSAQETDWLELEAWLAADPANASAYDAVEALWVELDGDAPAILARLGAPRRPGEATVIPFRRPTTAREERRLPQIVAIGAALAVAAGVAVTVMPPGPAPVVYQTGGGETRMIRLADGSRITLGSGSKISVKLDRKARHVVMSEAEAAFEVARDPTRPFLISVGDRQVRVAGAEFSVRRRQGHIMVTMRRGAVDVHPRGARRGEAARLTPGLQLAHREGATLSEIRALAPGERVAPLDE